VKSNTLGVAMKIEEYVPTTTPTIKAKMKPLMLSPPIKKMVSNTTKVESDVLTVRLNVLFNARFMVSSSLFFDP
jgi:hypothetical protein